MGKFAILLYIFAIILLLYGSFYGLNAFQQFSFDRNPNLSIEEDQSGILNLNTSNKIIAGVDNELLVSTQNPLNNSQYVTVNLEDDSWNFDDGTRTKSVSLPSNSFEEFRVYASPRISNGKKLQYTVKSESNSQTITINRNVIVENNFDLIVHSNRSIGDYSVIQYAVDNATTGDRIFVEKGFFNEQVTINKQLEIYASPDNNVEVNSPNASAFDITSSQTKIVGFSGISASEQGILIEADNVEIRGNEISGANNCIEVSNSIGFVAYNNLIQNCQNGIRVLDSDTSSIDSNTINSNNNGISIDKGNLQGVSYNDIESNDNGILVERASSSNIRNNNIQNNINSGITGYDRGGNTPIIDARNNWWGDTSGLSGGVQDVQTGIVADGTGDALVISKPGKGQGKPGNTNNIFRFDPWSNTTK